MDLFNVPKWADVVKKYEAMPGVNLSNFMYVILSERALVVEVAAGSLAGVVQSRGAPIGDQGLKTVWKDCVRSLVAKHQDYPPYRAQADRVARPYVPVSEYYLRVHFMSYTYLLQGSWCTAFDVLIASFVKYVILALCFHPT
jgi:hypothetical protein